MDSSNKDDSKEEAEEEENNVIKEKKKTKIEGKKQITPYLALCLIVVSIGCSLSTGWNTGLYNTPVKALREFFNETYYLRNSVPMSDAQWNTLWGITNGLFPLGAMFGGLACGHVSDSIGRKYAIIFINVLVLFSGGLTISSDYLNSYVPFMIGRFLTGIHCGLFSGIGAMYVSEIAPKSLRGAVGAFFQVASIVGTLWANIMGLPWIFGNSLWTSLVYITFIPAALLLFVFPFCVESPRYVYINRKNPEKAEKILRKLRGNADEEMIKQEMTDIDNEKLLSVAKAKVSYSDLFNRKDLKRRVILIIGIQMAHQFSGINTVSYYSTEIFIHLGLDSNTWAVYATILLDSLKVVCMILCMFLIEIAGRRKLYIAGLTGITISSFCLAFFPLMQDKSGWYQFLIVATTLVFVMSFGIGPSAITWLITPELFPSDSRGHAMSIAVPTNWFCSFVTTTFIPILMGLISHYIYVIFGFIAWFFIVFIYLKLPETKNKTIEEISRNFYY